MERRAYVRDVSPYFQQLIVELMREAYGARRRGDPHAYRVALEHLYDSLPEHVRREILSVLGQRLGAELRDVEDVLALADRECEEIMSRYGVPRREKEAECAARQLRILSALYSVMMKVVHDKGLLSVTRVIEVGYA